MYRQIADDLRRKIESGELVHGSQLPTEIDLREQYNASRNTVRDAIKWLITRRLVETRPGQGTFVVEEIRPVVTTLTSATGNSGGGEGAAFVQEVCAGGGTPTESAPRVEIQRASGVVANALRIKEGSQVVSRHQQRFINGIPYSLQTSYYPMSLVEKGATQLLFADNIEEGTVKYLAKQLRIEQAGYRDSIGVRAPDEMETAFFKLPADGRVSVFEIFRVAFDQRGDRFRLTATMYPADRNRFVINVHNVPRSETLEAYSREE